MPLLILILSVLLLVNYFLLQKLWGEDVSGREIGFVLALLVTCTVSAAVMLSLIVSTLRDACCMTDWTSWRIHNQSFDNDPTENSCKV